MFNQQQMIQEVMRRGQAEVEQSYVMMKAFSGGGGFAQNPLIQAFEHDRTVLELEVDAGALKQNVFNGYLGSPLCIMPCFWPHQLILGIPCYVSCFAAPMQDDAAKAHHLVLRENTLLYQVDPYPQGAQAANNIQHAVKPICVACCEAGQKAGGFTEVIPLQEIESCVVEPCMAKGCCGSDVATSTIVVRTIGGNPMLPAAAIDAPANGEAFCAAVMKAAEAAVCVAFEPSDPARRATRVERFRRASHRTTR